LPFVDGDPDQRPLGMPWQAAPPPRGLLGFLVHGLFSLFEVVIHLVLVPVRAIGAVFGGGVGWLLRLPFRLLGLFAQLVGFLLVAALVLLLVVTALHLFAAA
jgi:hypothetical protein